VLLVQGRRPCLTCPRQSAAIWVDADQDSYTGRGLPELTDTLAKRDFDAELAFLRVERDALIWYDSDGRLDLLLVDKAIDGSVEESYRVAADGELFVERVRSPSAPQRLSRTDVRPKKNRPVRPPWLD